jgi:beta-lactamase regulating signal transducer with metallopeptidase domain
MEAAMREYFNPDWTEYSFGILVTATAQATGLVLLASLASVCLRRAATRSALWTATIVGLAVMPVLSLVLPHCFLGYRSDAEPLHFPSVIARDLPGGFGASRLWTLADGTWAGRACQALLGVWAAGAAVALVRLLWGWVRVVSLLHLARPCRDARVKQIVVKVLAGHDNVAVLEIHGLVGALCWQIHRPKIILPADTRRLTDAELEMMIRHEWAHVRRNDPSALFVQRLVEIFYWYHPLVWLATFQVSKYREFACDDAVIREGFAAFDYAECLGRLAFWNYAPLPLAPAGLGMLWNQHVVLLRVKRLILGEYTFRETSRGRRTAYYSAAALIILACTVFRVDCAALSFRGTARWTAWPQWSAAALDTIHIEVRDFPLDAHRYDPSGTEKSNRF